MRRQSSIFLLLSVVWLVVGCVHKPPPLTIPHIPTIDTSQKPGVLIMPDGTVR
jgi:hypothetical protein